MKKFLSLVLVAAMVSNTAFASNTSVDHSAMIAKTFNQFRYKMTVSADATKADFKAAAVAEFKGRIADLQSQGVSSAEIMNHMRSTMLDSATRAEFDTLVASMGNVSSEEAGNIAMQFMANKYQQDDNYSGGGKANLKIAAIIIGVVIVGVVTYLCIKHCKKTDTATSTDTQTQTDTDTRTETETQTDTYTETQTWTNTNTNTNTNGNNENGNNEGGDIV